MVLNIKALNIPTYVNSVLNQLTYIIDDIFQLVRSKLVNIHWAHVIYYVFQQYF